MKAGVIGSAGQAIKELVRQILRRAASVNEVLPLLAFCLGFYPQVKRTAHAVIHVTAGMVTAFFDCRVQRLPQRLQVCFVFFDQA